MSTTTMPGSTALAGVRTAPLRVAVVGAGNRSTVYSDYAHEHPERMRVVAVADPDPARVRWFADRFAIEPGNQFASYHDLASRPGLADAVINGTMDELHYESSLALLNAGYDMLLEKPIARSEQEVRGLVREATRLGRTVVICHVLRYAPFYRRIKEVLDAGELGRIITVHTSEHVSYHHMATAFVRGKWNRAADSTPMIVAKCCHDTDLLAWLLEDTHPVRVASYGSLQHFRRDNAPPGATDRCLGGCAVEPTCPYSAKALYVEQNLWSGYVWNRRQCAAPPDRDAKLAELAGANPYGRCVWRCDNDVVDHQSVIVEFANGVTASHDMLCNTARPTRKIQIIGARGELEGDLADGMIVLRRLAPGAAGHYDEQRFDLKLSDHDPAGHGGGDARLVEDFVAVALGDAGAKAHSLLQKSLHGHLVAFAADRAMRERRSVEIDPRP